jgi:hypothetical protein
MKNKINVAEAFLVSLIYLFAFYFSVSGLFGQTSKPEEPSFCELVREPTKYDGHLVRISAQYSTTAHAALIAAKSCPSSSTEKYFAAPTWSHDFDLAGKNAKSLFKILRDGGTADVTFVGVVRALPHEKYGFYDAPVQLELKKIETVKRDPVP